MKSINSVAVVLLLISITAKAQEDQTDKNKSDFFSLGLSMGIIGNISSQKINTNDKPGFNYNIDLSYTPETKTGFFVNYSSSQLRGYPEYSYPNMQRKIEYIQVCLGPRFYSSEKNSFLDAGPGYSNINNDEVIGATFGLGGKFKISDRYAVTLVGRVYASDIFNNIYVNYTLSSGFEIRSNDKASDTKDIKGAYNNLNDRNRKFSVAILAGTFVKKPDYPGGKSFKAEFSYELAKKTMFLLNYLYVRSENDYSGYINTNYKQSRSEYTFGVRYYLKDDNLKFFAEGLSGAYIVSLENISNFWGKYHSTISFAGFTLGGGVELKLVDQLSGVIKADVSNTFSENKSYSKVTGSYLGFFGGLKYNM